MFVLRWMFVIRQKNRFGSTPPPKKRAAHAAVVQREILVASGAPASIRIVLREICAKARKNSKSQVRLDSRSTQDNKNEQNSKPTANRSATPRTRITLPRRSGTAARGPPAEWRRWFISAYAAMHPWEDFAETFGAYLDMVSVLDTAFQLGFSGGTEPRSAALDDMVRHYQDLGVMLNEMNRAMGLTDLVPEVFGPAAVEKLRFVDRVAGEARGPQAP